MGFRRLRHHRHHAFDRRRVAVRGGRRLRGRARARCRRRQGNASLAAARRFADVTSTDYVPHLLELGKSRAEGERLTLVFEVADAENLPYADAAFDVVLSTFGAMFAPDQPRTASEMIRVVRPGGRIGLASWTPEGFVGELFRLMASFAPPPPGLPSPTQWGSEKRLAEMFGAQASEIRSERRVFNFRYRSAEHWIEIFRALRTDAQGVRSAAARSAERSARRADRASVASQPRARQRQARRARRISGNGDREALIRHRPRRRPGW